MELLLHISKKLKKTSDHKKMRSAFRGRRLRGLFPILKRRKFCNKDHSVTMEILWGNYESKKMYKWRTIESGLARPREVWIV